ncbi:hypothetical protein RI129_004223 [Pyrocoelia pectoralis]|uniref:AD domain-containing protein n=1 Tax=Pyrocoelia pectoralis TaxID=417401 RepID=A0AAN7VGC6_9COLE
MDFNFDPRYLKSMMGKSVHLSTIDNKSHYGTLYVVDPVSYAFVLATSSEEDSKHTIRIYPYNSIKDCVEVTGLPLDNLITVNKVPPEEYNERKRKLIDWFVKNQLELHDDNGILKLNDYVLTIEPPYEAEQCFCDNIIVLDRIRTLIKNMPL